MADKGCQYVYVDGHPCPWVGDVGWLGFCAAHAQEEMIRRRARARYLERQPPVEAVYDRTAPWCSDPECKCDKPNQADWLVAMKEKYGIA